MERFSSVAMLRWIRRNTKAKSRPDGLDAYEVSALVILLSHAGHADAPGFAALSPGELVEQVPMSRGQLYRTLTSLTDRGVVTPDEQLVGGALKKGYTLHEHVSVRDMSLSETDLSTTETVLSLSETDLSTTETNGPPSARRFVSDRDRFVSDRDTRTNKDARAKWGMGKERRKEEEESARDPDAPDVHGREQLDEPEVSVEEVHELAQRATQRGYVLSDTWRTRYEHIAAHWTRSEIVEALTATLRAPRPSWAYARTCLERMAKDGPALVVAASEATAGEAWDAPPDQFPELGDAEVLELAGDEIVTAWRDHLIDLHHVARYPDDHPIWPEMIAPQLRELGVVAPPGVRR